MFALLGIYKKRQALQLGWVSKTKGVAESSIVFVLIERHCETDVGKSWYHVMEHVGITFAIGEMGVFQDGEVGI